MQAYDSIADLYDSFVQTELDIPFFLEEARRAGGDVLELMAGTGRVSLPLAEAGARLTCVDGSAEMLGVLRRKLDAGGWSAELHAVDVRNLALGRRFGLVIIPFHAFPEITGRADQLRALLRIRNHLAEDGRLIVTLHNPAVRRTAIDGLLHLAADRPQPDGRLLAWVQQSADDEGLVTVREFFETYDARGMLVEKRLATLSFRLIERAPFEALIDEAGFAADALYGDYARAPFDETRSPFMIWRLRRAG